MRLYTLFTVLFVTQMFVPVACRGAAVGRSGGTAGLHDGSAAATRAMRDPGVSPPGERKVKLQSILGRSEFKGSAPSWLGRLSDRIERAIIRWLSGVLGSSAGGAIDFVLTALAVVVVVLMVVLMGYGAWLAGRRLMRGLPASEADEVYVGPDSPRKVLDEAARLAASGDFRSALRLVYLAALLKLDERELIRFDRTGTNWEYLALLRDHPALYRTLRPVTLTFDRKWYGREPATESDYQSFVTAYASVESFEVGR